MWMKILIISLTSELFSYRGTYLGMKYVSYLLLSNNTTTNLVDF